MELFIEDIEKAISNQTLIEVLKDILETYRLFVKRVRNGQRSPYLVKAIQYISANIFNGVSVSNVAAFVSISPQHLSRILKKEVGISLHTFILETEITKSKELLLETRGTVGEIAISLGFSTTSYFTQIFKKRTGDTPIHFRTSVVVEKDLER